MATAGRRRARLQPVAGRGGRGHLRAPHLRRPLHGVVLRVDGREPEPDRDVLHGRDGARVDALVPRSRPEHGRASPSSRRTTRTRWRSTRRSAATLHIPYVYDPSQQVARLSGSELLAGLEGAAILIANEYEFGVIEKKTGLSEAEVLERGARPDRDARRRRLHDRPPRTDNPTHPAGATTLRIPPAAPARSRGGPDGRRRRLPRRVSSRPATAGCRGRSRAGSGAWPPSTPSRPSVRSRRATRSRTFVARYRENYGSEGDHDATSRGADFRPAEARTLAGPMNVDRRSSLLHRTPFRHRGRPHERPRRVAPRRRRARRVPPHGRRRRRTSSSCAHPAPGRSRSPSAISARSGRFDALVALGAVLRGGTPHFDYVAGETAKGVFQVSLELDLPGLVRRSHVRHARAGARALRRQGRQQGLRGGHGRRRGRRPPREPDEGSVPSAPRADGRAEGRA